MTTDQPKLSVVPDEREDDLFKLAEAFAAQAAEPRQDDMQRVSEALLAGRARARKKAVRVQFVQFFAAAAVVALAVSVPMWRYRSGAIEVEPRSGGRTLAAQDAGTRAPLVVVQPIAAPSAPTRVALRQHQMTVEPGSDWAIETPRGDQTEAFVVKSGTVLFDVKPLASGEHFRVKAASIQVEVMGTVFSVSGDHDRARVRVYEGSVLIRRPSGTTISLAAPGAFDTEDDDARPDAPAANDRVTDAGVAAVAEAWPLEPWGLAAAAHRASQPATTAVSEPVAENPPEGPTAQRANPSQERPAEQPAPSDTTAETTSDDAPRPARGNAPANSLDLDDARTMIAAGQHREVLQAIREGRNVGRTAGEWALVEGDAYSVQQDHAQAASAYERATRSANASRAAVAGHLAAIEYEQLHRYPDAIRVLEQTRAYSGNSPVGQSAANLRARLLFATGRKEEAREAAHAYLVVWPHGRFAAEMTRIESSP